MIVPSSNMKSEAVIVGPVLSTAQQLTIANFARGVSKENFVVATLPSAEGPSYVYANVPQSEKLISRLFFAGQPNSVKLSVPGQPPVASRRILTARANGSSHRRRRRRRRTPPPTIGTVTVAVGAALRSRRVSSASC